MNILIALFPALVWGAGPIIATIVGGKPINQLLGTGYGQMIVGVILYLIFRPEMTLSAFFWCFLGGALWSIAQLMQFTSFVEMDVSTAMPVSTGLQLIEIPLSGVIFWGEWASGQSKLIGFLSIVLLIVGITFTSLRSKRNQNSAPKKKMNYKKGMLMLLIGSFGYTACSVFPRIPNASGMTGLLPQTLGMFFGGVVLAAIMNHRNSNVSGSSNGAAAKPIWYDKWTKESITIGLLGGLGTLAYLTSLKLNGVATSFPLTQLNVVVSTIGAIVILHEHKTHQELTFTLVGLIMIMIAAFMIAKIS
ncbi:glucose uptake protein [Philodulcilactobacillus myokoensis]|uniref:Glucose uptake protein n=1 Tax=Philodulcilactobacillus myokoensis TaxID=2929573 RepID=A0A9W6B010_9LACO|nr:GRP family sugar transporter [Philodulcilactobacillus myokoensis]GLB46111.1 glucose uptake protein [Philodulcilactobacillus myokoensis]